MTPTERARLIDEAEFAAECAAVRARVLDAVKAKQEATRETFVRWTPRLVQEPFRAAIAPAKPTRKERPLVFGTRGTLATLITYGGETLTRREWADRLGITPSALASRIVRLGGEAAAIEAGGLYSRDTPGYIQTSQSALGTGVGRHVRDLQPNSEKSQC